MGGTGETVLEIEKQTIKDREAKLKRELDELHWRQDHKKVKSTHKLASMPVIALIGYTNAGKSAIVNMSTGSSLESEDRLFQTLNTA